MDTQKQQSLIDGYLRGTLSISDQGAFDSLFANDPSFSEKVTQALAAQVGEAPSDYVDAVASRLDPRWESLFRKSTRVADRGWFLESAVLVAALAILAGAGWYVWKTLAAASPEAQQAAAAPRVVLAFKLPSVQAASWKPKRTFADAERDFAAKNGSTVQRPSSSSAEKSFVPSVQRPADASLSGQVLRIRIEVPRALKGRVTLWNADGTLVRKLFEGSMPQGTWALDWDQKNEAGRQVQPGSYSVHVEAGDEVLSGTVVVTSDP